MTSWTSSVYKVKVNGPTTDPCGTPKNSKWREDRSFSVNMHCSEFHLWNKKESPAHADDLVRDRANNMYTTNVLWAHGLKKECLEEVLFRARSCPRYHASPACWGLASQRAIDRIKGFLKKPYSSVIIRTLDCCLKASVNLPMTDFFWRNWKQSQSCIL